MNQQKFPRLPPPSPSTRFQFSNGFKDVLLFQPFWNSHDYLVSLFGGDKCVNFRVPVVVNSMRGRGAIRKGAPLRFRDHWKLGVRGSAISENSDRRDIAGKM